MAERPGGSEEEPRRPGRRPGPDRPRRITLAMTESEYEALRSLRTPDAPMAAILRAAIAYLAAHPKAAAEVQGEAEARE